MQTQVTQDRPFTGRHMAAIVITFFAVVVGVNVTMAVLARQTWTGLIVPNTYVASQNFNRETEIREAFLARGDRFDLRYENGVLKFALQDKNGQRIPIKRAKLRLFPNGSVKEVTYALQCVSGECEASLALLPGLWRGDMQLGMTGQHSFQQPIEILVKDE